MEKQEPHIIPSIYLANYLNDFEEIILNSRFHSWWRLGKAWGYYDMIFKHS